MSERRTRTQPRGNPQSRGEPRAVEGGEAVEGGGASGHERLRAALPGPSSILALVAVVIGLSGLVGWATGILGLAEVMPDTVPMKANAAVLLVLLGAASILLAEGHWPRLARALALVALVVASATALEFLSGRDFGIDQLLVSDIDRPGAPYPGRMAVGAAGVFITMSLAVLLYGRSWRGRYPTTFLALAAVAVAGLGLLGYAYGASELMSIGSPTLIAFPTALGSVALAAGILASDQRHGVKVLTDRGLAGQLARRIVSVVLLVLPVAFWLSLQLEQAGIIGQRYGAAVVTASELVLFGVLGVWAANGIGRIERRRTEAARSLGQSRELLNETEQLAKVGGWAYDIASRTVTWTDEVYRIHEVSREDYDPGSPVLNVKFYAPEDQATIDEAFRLAVEEGRSYDLKLRLVTAKGRELWIETTGRPQLENGRVVRVTGHIQDIGERVAAGEAEARYRGLLEAAPDAMVVVNGAGRIVLLNVQAERQFGYHRDELVGRKVTAIIPEGFAEGLIADDLRSTESTLAEGTGTGIGLVALRKDGSEFPIEMMLSPVKVPGEVFGWLAIIRDVTEREQATAALAASEARLRTALGNMLEGVVVVSALRDEAGRIVDFRIDYVNQAIGPISGVPASDQVGHTLLELFPAHRANGLFDAYVAVVETGVAFESPDFHYVDPDAAGGPLVQYVDHSVTKMGDGYVLSVRDVTERHQAEAERARLSAAIEQSDDGIVILDSDLQISYANAAFAGHLGRDPSELLGHGIIEVVSSVLDATTLAALVEVARAARPWLGETDRRVADGSVGRIQVSVTPRRAANGTVEDFVINVRDVTELRRGEAERTRLATAIEQSADGIVITTAEANIEYVNPAFERISGYTREEVLGQNPRILNSGAQEAAFYEAMWTTLTSGRSFGGDLTNRAKDGSLFEVEAVISPIVDAGGKITSYVAVEHDVTSQRAAEAASVRRARERAQIADALAGLRAGPSPEATAEAICLEVIRLAGIRSAALWRFGIEGRAMPLAFVRADLTPVPLRPLPARRSEELRKRAIGGPWVEASVRRPWHPYDRLLQEMGIRAVGQVPVRYGGDLVGLLSITSADEDAISRLTELLPAQLEFAVVSGVLVGPAIAGLTQAGSVRRQIAGIIGSGLFHPVFQPIIRLESRETVGYEALTRFDSGQRPDLCFAEARAVEMGPDLELATLGAAVAAARKLPAGRWLSLNVSPRLLLQTERLAAVLWPSERPIYLEITEHEIIDDYKAVSAAIRALGHGVHLAVDDAGAGIANFSHIIELRPKLVKLDMSLVRDVNVDLGRQAMVVGMRHFARQAGCRLLAEGIQTEQEAGTLNQLAVELGQGFLFGRPEPAQTWATAGKTARREPSGRGSSMTPPPGLGAGAAAQASNGRAGRGKGADRA
jgi:PAS domain S-box-containing protein